jgi:hypothetical protein
MSSIAAVSTNQDSQTAAKEIAAQFASIDPKMIIYFASSEYNQAILAMEMKKPYPTISVFGCSTAGEIITGKMLEHTCVAMAFDRDTIEDCWLEIALDITKKTPIENVFDSYKSHYNIPINTINPKEYVGLLLVDGLRKAEEKIMEIIAKCTPVHFVGGSAGDDLRLKETWVHFNGQALTNAAVFALIKPKKGFSIIKTQSFEFMHKVLTATEVDEANRIVMEFNYKPAAKAYSEVLGVPEEELPEKFMTHPVGVMLKGEPFVRSPQQLQGRSIIFHCAVKHGMEVEVLKSANIIEDTTRALATVLTKISSPSGLVTFNCIHRTIELYEKGQLDQYGAIFRNIPTVGFSTYGEQYFTHINQTATMVVFH